MRLAKDIADMAFMMATGVFGASKYRRDNNAYNYGANYNVGLWENGAWHSDCLGFVHIVVNGFYGDRNLLGGGAVMDDFVWMSDEATTLHGYCTRKGGFPVASLNPATLLQSSGHVGLYIGDHTVNGYTYNTAECTLALGGGWLLTWVDLNTGARYSRKNGSRLTTGWAHWGEFDQVDYSNSKQTFTDVTPSMSSYKAIEWAAKQGIVVGYNDGTFRPSNNCTRAQFVTMLWRYAGRPEVSVEVRFNDVSKGMSAYKAIAWAYSTGIIVGYRDGTFRPNKNLTRAQIVTMLWRFNGRPFAESGKTFKDVTVSMSAYRAIMWATAKGVVMGYSDGTFRPSNNCTRQQLAVILWRMAGRP